MFIKIRVRSKYDKPDFDKYSLQGLMKCVRQEQTRLTSSLFNTLMPSSLFDLTLFIFIMGVWISLFLITSFTEYFEMFSAV